MKKGELMNSRRYLSDIPIFRNLTKRELNEVEGIMHKRTVRDMEVIAQAGEPPLAIYIIKSGRVDFVIGKPGEEGGIIESYSGGDVIGEICIFDDEPRPSSIISRGDSELLGIFKYDLDGLMKKNPRLGYKILKNVGSTLVKRVRKLNALLGETVNKKTDD